MSARTLREVQLLDAELWDLPASLSADECRFQTGLIRDGHPRNPDGEPLEDDR